MDIKKQFSTKEQSQTLKSLGVKAVKPQRYWVCLAAYKKGFELMLAEEAEYKGQETKNIAFTDFDDTYPAFSTGELGVLLPPNVESQYKDDLWNCRILKRNFPHPVFEDNHNYFIVTSDFSQAEAMASMLIELLTHNLISVEDCNNKLLKD